MHIYLSLAGNVPLHYISRERIIKCNITRSGDIALFSIVKITMPFASTHAKKKKNKEINCTKIKISLTFFGKVEEECFHCMDYLFLSRSKG